MSKREKGLWILYAVALVLLFLMSSTNLIIKEKQVEIYPISIVIEDSKDEYYLNLKKGIDQAAREYHVDTNFITLYEKNDQKQQMEMINRERNDGSKGIILVPVNEGELNRMLAAKAVNCPMAVLGAQISNEWVTANISMDYYEAGKKLGEAVVREKSKEIPVCLFTEGLIYGSNAKVYEGVMAVLEENGFHVTLQSRSTGDAFRNIIEETVYPGSGEMVIIALDTKTLSETAEIIGESTVYHNYITGLYGVGSTIPILNYLDREVIQGIVVYNQFDAGYLSIQKMVDSMRKGGQTEQITLESFYIEKKDLRDKKYEKMLYPME